MQTLILGMVVFYGAHALPLVGLSAPLKERLGGNAYKSLFAVVALVGLALMVWGFVMARSGPDAARIVYNPPEWGRHVTMLLVLLALISLAVYGHKGRLKLWLRHPMSIGVALWAAGHLFSNGNLSEVLFFGGFLALALADIGVGLARGTRPEFTPKPLHDLIAVVAGVVLYFVFLWLHPMVIGMSVT
jgi:uncharacterized membrane protein